MFDEKRGNNIKCGKVIVPLQKARSTLGNIFSFLIRVVYMFCITINRGVKLALSVCCPSVFNLL